MSEGNSPHSAGASLEKLLYQWRAQHRPSAEGGWWALAGFSFQMGIFLLRFFRNLQEGDSEPGVYAEVECLSDILAPQDGKLILIQVKRALTKEKLIDSVREAYIITSLCYQETPQLLARLRFQIACHSRKALHQLGDLSMSEVVPEGNPERWNDMLKMFDPVKPISEEPDPLDHLHLYLWNCGIQNTTELIEACLGHLLRYFGIEDPSTSRNVGRELANLFFQAKRRAPWEPFGQVLTPDDIAPDAKAADYKGVLTGQRPTLEHLRKGYFRERQEIFQRLWKEFRQWLHTCHMADCFVPDKTPVFWLSGRSGDGKSVLLLQLVAQLLGSSESCALLRIKREDLPRLLEKATQEAGVPAGVLAVIDDLYDLSDRERWEEDVRQAYSLGLPCLAVVTCGVTEQLEQFQRQLGDLFAVSSFQVPKLDVRECLAFKDWYVQRTGRSVNLSRVTKANPLLVQFMFEMAQCLNMRDFAVRFKKRVTLLGIFERVRTILAANALYLDAPLSLLPHDNDRDVLERLCAEDQLHFRIKLPSDSLRTGGVRLAHPHLAWRLFVEWADVGPGTTLSKAWARELAAIHALLERENSPLAVSNLLRQLLNSSRLSDEPEDVPSKTTAHRRELIRELYRLYALAHDGYPSLESLPTWLDLELNIPGLHLDPNPTMHAVTAMLDDSRANVLHGSVSAKVWLLSESEPPSKAAHYRDAVRRFVQRFPENPGVCSSISCILGQSHNDAEARRLARDWLVANARHPHAHYLLKELVAANRGDVEMQELAVNWLMANPNHQQTGQVLCALLAASAGSTKAQELATSWLAANSNHPEAQNILAALLRASAGQPAVRKLTIDWLADNPSHPHAYSLIKTLVATAPGEAEARRIATEWLEADPRHPQAYELIRTFVAANVRDTEVRKLAIDWLATHEGHRRASLVMTPLVAANPGDAGVRQIALSWLTSKRRRRPYRILMTLVAANPEDAGVRKLAMRWVAANRRRPLACQVVSALVAANAGDAEVRKFAMDWLTANPRHPRLDDVLRTLVAGNAEDAEVRKLAMDWVAANRLRPLAYQVISALVAANAGDAEVRKLAMEWLTANPCHPRVDDVLRTLVARNAEDAEVRKLATEWLTANPRHPRVYEVLKTLVATGGADAELRKLATDWLESNAGHPQYFELLRVMIARSEDSDKWFDLGEQYVKNPANRHPEQIIAVLLGRGRTALRFVELAVDHMAGPITPGSRDFLMLELGCGLVYNLDSAVQYLNGPYDEQKKSMLCKAMAWGMKRYPMQVAAFARDAGNRVDGQYVYCILSELLCGQIQSPDLDTLVTQWLIDNFRRPTYWALLNMLRVDKEWQRRLETTGRLPEAILTDVGREGQGSG